VNEQDRPGPDDPAFDDPAHDELRALLADVRATEPVPDDVAARLDATLASLQADREAVDTHLEPAPASTGEVVVPLPHRLRRGAGRVLVAAAVLAVVGAGGVGIAQLTGDSAGNDATTSADQARDDAGGGSAVAPEATGATGDVPRAAHAARAVPELTTDAFAADAARVMVDLSADQKLTTLDKSMSGSVPGPRSPAEGYAALEAPAVTATPQRPTDSADTLGTSTCAGPEAPDAVTLPATLDGGLVALVFRPPGDATQRVEAWSCDGATLLQAATVSTTPPD
jgi:hypothetical protein